MLKEGLCVLTAMDYLPSTVSVVENASDDFAVLETFFIDADIEEIARTSIEITEIEEV
jgi:hypothetical protein